MLLSAAVSLFQRRDVKPATTRWYDVRFKELLEQLGDVAVDAIEADDLYAWRDSLLARRKRYTSAAASRPAIEGGLSPRTVRGYVRAIRTLWKWMHEEARIAAANPSRLVRMPDKGKRAIKYISEASVEKMVLAARANSARDWALVATLRDSGARAGGLASMNRSDVDLTRRRMVVHEKGDATRVVFFLEETGEALRLYLATRRDGDAAMFVGRNGRLTTSGIYQVLARTAKRAGVEKPYNPHAFRHGLAHRMLSNGATLEDVSQVLGHSSIEVTRKHYSQWAVDELQEKHRRFARRTDNGAVRSGPAKGAASFARIQQEPTT